MKQQYSKSCFLLSKCNIDKTQSLESLIDSGVRVHDISAVTPHFVI